MKNLKTVIAAVAVFAMTIGSGFAMETHPPTEPVKGKVATEVIEEAPMQTVYMGFVAYKDILGNCINIPNPMHCTLTNTGTRCAVTIEGNTYFLFTAIQNPITLVWSCGLPLYKIP